MNRFVSYVILHFPPESTVQSLCTRVRVQVLRCERAVLEYVDERDDEQLIRQTGIAFAYPGFDMRKIQQCFRALKQRLLAARAPAAATATAAALESDSSARSQAQSSSNSYNNSSNSLPAQQISISLENPVYANREMRDLRDIIQQRDNEISPFCLQLH